MDGDLRLPVEIEEHFLMKRKCLTNCNDIPFLIVL